MDIFQAVGNNDSERVQQLLASGISPNVQNQNLCTPLHRAYRSVDMLRLLINAGANLNAQDITDCTVLHRSAYWSIAIDKYDTLQLLIDSGINCSVQNNMDETVLHILVHRNYTINAIRLVINAGANYDLQDIEGNTVFHLASKLLYFELIGILMDNNANPFIKNNKKQLAIDKCKDEHIRIMIYLYMDKFGVENIDKMSLTHIVR